MESGDLKNESNNGTDSQDEQNEPKSTEERLQAIDESIARMKLRKRTIIKKSKEAITKADNHAKILAGVALFKAIADKTIDANTAKSILKKIEEEDRQAILKAVENEKSTIKENIREKVIELFKPKPEEATESQALQNSQQPNDNSSAKSTKPIPTTELSRGSRREKRSTAKKDHV